MSFRNNIKRHYNRITTTVVTATQKQQKKIRSSVATIPTYRTPQPKPNTTLCRKPKNFHPLAFFLLCHLANLALSDIYRASFFLSHQVVDVKNLTGKEGTKEAEAFCRRARMLLPCLGYRNIRIPFNLCLFFFLILRESCSELDYMRISGIFVHLFHNGKCYSNVN